LDQCRRNDEHFWQEKLSESARMGAVWQSCCCQAGGWFSVVRSGSAAFFCRKSDPLSQGDFSNGLIPRKRRALFSFLEHPRQ
jgi:hypothetical protein